MANGALPTKQALRQSIASTLRAIPPAELAAKSAAIRELVQSLPFWKSASLILSYAPLLDEVDLNGVRDERTAYPKMVGAGLQAWLPNVKEVMAPGLFRIAEPSPATARPIKPEELDIILVPGRLFQKNGIRLGRGKGFYDRFLADPKLRAIKVGICFSAQLSNAITPDPWDVPMDWIVHEGGIIDSKAGGD